MYKLLALLTVSLMTAGAHAEIFTCHFNEPFIQVSLNTETGDVKWTDLTRSHFATRVEAVAVSETAVGAAFWRGDIYYRLALDLTRWGSDGMSNYSYPVRGELLDYWRDDFGFYRNLVGGCYSAERPRMCYYPDCI